MCGVDLAINPRSPTNISVEQRQDLIQLLWDAKYKDIKAEA